MCSVTKSCLTLCDPTDYSLPGSSVHEISQTRILEGVTISFSRKSSQLSNRIHISCLAGRFFTTEPPGKPFLKAILPLKTNYCILKFWALYSSYLVLEKTLESPLDCKEIQPVHSKGDQPWDFFGRNDPKAETPVLWPPHAKSWLIGKDPDAGRDWGQEEMGTTEDEMAGWHHWLDGHEFEWTLGAGDGQGGLASCNSWGHKESDTTEQLNWTELILHIYVLCINWALK